MGDGTRLAPLDKAGLERMSRFRYELRRFLRFGEEISREAGVTALQYHLLLHTQAFAGREWASVGELAERLQSAPHGVVALVTRCEQMGLVRRRDSAADGRLSEVHLTAKGRKVLDRLAAQHQAHLGELAAVIEAARFGQ
ncbi:MAG: MarR family transcriptional regulator [Burkholderiales bacterium]|nr:MarR family transcriptional regulator [Burkholderiales bacterium]